MKLPVDLFLQAIQPRQIYFFTSEKLNTEVPHYFICLSRTENDFVILACCTSQFEKRRKFIEAAGLPFSTLVWINPDGENGLRMDSYVDCNSYFDYSLEEFKRLYESNELEYKGKLSESHFDQILIGIKDSPLIEEAIKDLIVK